jgi:opacity protein-like surface antigen
MTRFFPRRVVTTAIQVAVIMGVFSSLAHAQTYISPLVGFDFGGVSGCPTITDCEDKRLNAGIAFGRMGPVLGVETEIAYARDFFGKAPDVASSLLTWTGNVMLIPDFGLLRPYGLVGIGLMRTRVELTVPGIVNAHNQFGWNMGGGAMLFFGSHVGIRADVRYFRSVQELPVLNIPIEGDQIDFGRASAALVFRF